MKRISLLISSIVLAMVLVACSAEKNHENTTETQNPTSAPTHTQGVGEDMMDAAGDATNAVGDGVKKVGDAVKNTVK